MKSVYVISTNVGLVKIGISHQPEKRLAMARPGQQPTLFWHSELRLDARSIESEVHRRLLDRRDRGEWFAVSASEAVDAIKSVLAAVDAGEQFKAHQLPLHQATDSDSSWADGSDVEEGDASWVASILLDLCKKAGGQAEWAYRNRISRQHLSSVINGHCPPSPRILAILGLEKVETEEEFQFIPGYDTSRYDYLK